MIVKFTHRFESFNAGEMGGFDEKVARDLVARGIAVIPNALARVAHEIATDIDDTIVNPIKHELTEAHVEFLNLCGKTVAGVEEAKAFVEGLGEKAEEFIRDAERTFPSIAELKAKLEALETKAKIVAFGKVEYGLELNEKDTRDDLTKAVLAKQVEFACVGVAGDGDKAGQSGE